ncbi:MAG: hypothetical protein ACK4F0_06025 [Candidatus Ratteibacteria bacterium]
MRKVFFNFFILHFLLFSEYKYLLNLSCENKKLLDAAKVASFNFISGKERYNDIKIIDENGKECKILGVNFSKNEIEVFFEPTDTINYKVFIGYTDKKKEYERFRYGKILIDDYNPPDSIKSGIWVWVDKSLSGLYSHTGTSGFSFHRVSFSKQFPVNIDDKIITYVFIEDDNVEEIMVEVVSRYRRHYYFSFGEDKIDIKGISKEKIGDLPEKGRWMKIEIPLLKVREKNIEGIGFYNDKGKVYWDLTSINEVPVKMKIVKVENLIFPNTPYFNYEVEGPFKIKDKKIVILKLDASCFLADRYSWEIDGENYYGQKLITELKGEKKEINVKLKVEKNKNYGEFSHKIIFDEVKEVNTNFNILPFESFIYNDEKIYIPIRIENISEVPIVYNLKFQKDKQELSLLPGRENGKTVTLSLNLEDEIKIKLYFYDIELAEKTIKILNPDENDYSIDGPFLRKNNSYIIFKVPEYKNIKKEKKFSKIIFVGDFPEEINYILKNKGFEVLSIKEDKYINYLFAEFKFIQKNLKRIENDSFVVLFPFLNSLLRRHKLNEWEKVYDGILYLLSQKTSYILLISPFPSYPYLEIFQPYRERIRKISERRDFYFLDLYKIFSEIEKGEKFFKLNEYVYKNFPDIDGFEVVLKEIEKIIENEESINNQRGSAW